jgi:hypothetical protein
MSESSPLPESHLLGSADAILRDAGFITRRTILAGSSAPCLFAEDAFFVIAVVAARRLSDATRLESFAAADLLERLAASPFGGKRWDAYVVVLSEETLPADSEHARNLVDLQYNTRGVRRLIAMGVSDVASLSSALRPFLPLPDPAPGGLSDALEDLTEQLVVNGIDRDLAERYIAAFRDTGTLDDL